MRNEFFIDLIGTKVAKKSFYGSRASVQHFAQSDNREFHSHQQPQSRNVGPAHARGHNRVNDQFSHP